MVNDTAANSTPPALFVRVYVCVCVCMCVRVYVCACACECVRVHLRAQANLCVVSACARISKSASMFVRVCALRIYASTHTSHTRAFCDPVSPLTHPYTKHTPCRTITLTRSGIVEFFRLCNVRLLHWHFVYPRKLTPHELHQAPCLRGHHLSTTAQ